jgi:hypothetical protein
VLNSCREQMQWAPRAHIEKECLQNHALMHHSASWVQAAGFKHSTFKLLTVNQVNHAVQARPGTLLVWAPPGWSEPA